MLQGCNPQHLLLLSMLDFPLMLWVKLSIQPQSNRFAMGAENEATGVSNLNDSPVLGAQHLGWNEKIDFLHKLQ